jgi:tetratricopeptide (TPR) repeat protein
MASSARIDELRKKFDENPRRYFAPLANEYRKAGDLDQAIFICREYLPQQPGHMSGHIVYGQALYEQNRFEESRHVFETALLLDPENLIALRHLGDIARQGGDSRAARGWYQRVLEADPRNEEIAQLMMSLLATPAESSEDVDEGDDKDAVQRFASGGDFSSPVEAVAHEGKSEEISDQTAGSEPTPASVAQPAAEPESAWQPPQQAPDQELVDLNEVTIAGVRLSELGVTASIDEPAPADSFTESSSGESPSSESVAETSLSGQVSSATGHGPGDSAVHADAAAHMPAPHEIEKAFLSDVAARQESSVSASGHTAPEPNVESMPVAATAQAFVTETMADLYLQQGHPESALEIYHKLVSQRPEDARLRARMRVIERQVQRQGAAPSVVATAVAEGMNIREFLAGIVVRRPTATAASAVDSARREAERQVEREAMALRAQSMEHLKVPTPVAQMASIDEDFGSPFPTPEVALDLVSAEAAVEAFRVSFGEPAFEVPTDSRVPERVTIPSGAAAAASRGTPAAPSETVRGSLGALFANADAASGPGIAKPSPAQSPEPQPLQGAPAHKAASELSLDHVFKKGKAPRESDPDRLSFDQFFADHLVEGSAKSGAEPKGSPRQGADDVAQFNTWLNRLKKKT